MCTSFSIHCYASHLLPLLATVAHTCGGRVCAPCTSATFHACHASCLCWHPSHPLFRATLNSRVTGPRILEELQAEGLMIQRQSYDPIYGEGDDAQNLQFFQSKQSRYIMTRVICQKHRAPAPTTKTDGRPIVAHGFHLQAARSSLVQLLSH